MKMYVYVSANRHPVTGELTPIVIETNMDFAVPYWNNRKKQNPKIFWKFQ